MGSIKSIKIDIDKCTGCRSCEANCSAFHADPKYSLVNPKRARIRIFWDEENDLFVPILAGQYTDADCNGKNIIIIKGREYGQCSFCRASCPSRDLFIEPDADIPLKCDMCGEPPPLDGPACVKACLFNALTYVAREEVENQEKKGELEVGLESLADKYGLQRIVNTVSRISDKNQTIQKRESLVK